MYVCDRFYSLSAMLCNRFCLELLVQFLTFKSELFEQNAINKMEIELPSSDANKQSSNTAAQSMYNDYVLMYWCVYLMICEVVRFSTTILLYITRYTHGLNASYN